VLENLCKRAKALARIVAHHRREDGLNVLEKLEAADRTEDGHGRAKAISDAMRRSKPKGGGTIADVYLRDDPAANPAPIADPATARAELARTGAAAMADMRGEGFHEPAHEAWGAAIFGEGRKWPEMTLDGRPWTIEEALSDERLEVALRKTKQKAVGADGVDIVWLRAKVAGTLLVPTAFCRTFLAALRACAIEGRYPKTYRQILYVLLTKPGADPRVIRERREIALLHSLKLILSTLLRGVAAVAQSHLLPEQTGWTEACGAVDASCLFVALHGRALARPGYGVILFLDLKQFFPRIPTRGIEIETILHGLPPDLQRLAARDFAVMAVRYDKQLELGDEFTIEWGALMGCVLSTQKARVLLSSLLAAIIRYVRGTRLYGSSNAAFVDMQADDLAGVIHHADRAQAWGDAERAWEICCAWAAASAERIGIKDEKKNAFAALKIHERLKVTDAAHPPRLCLNDGSAVPRLGANDSYKHMGVWRTMNGDTTAAAKAFHDKAHEVNARIKQLWLPVRALFRAADIIVGGTLTYPGTTSVASRAECNAAEAGWRAILPKRSARALSSPRWDLYDEGWRTHVYAAIGAGALHAVFRIGTRMTPACGVRYGPS
jgi:hypothetical protein